MMNPRIVVVGSTNTDMIIKVPHLPLPGETVLGDEFKVVQGGKGANQAVAAARAGGAVVFLSCVGTDLFGSRSMDELSKEGIDITAMKVTTEYPSGIALINVAASGENSISVAPGANSQLYPEDLEKLESYILASDIVLVQLEIPMETVNITVKMANKHQVPVILNPAPARPIDPWLLRAVDYITPNENEAALIAGMGIQGRAGDHVGIAGVLQKMGSKNTIITLGKMGAYCLNKKAGELIPGFGVEAVDSTAAGDTFNGYLAVCLADGMDLRDAIYKANKAASISVTRLGAQTSIPFRTEVEESLPL